MFHRRQEQPQHHLGATPEVGYGEPDDGQDYVDRSKIDFDPAEGLLGGTAIPVEQHLHTHRADTAQEEPQ